MRPLSIHLFFIFSRALRLAVAAACAASFLSRADLVDDTVTAQMQAHHVHGLSLAIARGGKIIRAQGYGFADKEGTNPVTPETLFQAGSVSKAVAAFAALHLVQENRLSLDADVSAELTTWKLPDNEFTREKKVTLRGILNHSAGLTIHGFGGYPVTASIPTLVQVLDGVKPANSSPVRVNIPPGSQWRYSGGGYTVMQQMMLDATHEPFPQFLAETVLEPLGMTNSTYEQPPPEALAARTAAGMFSEGHWVKGRWHVYPEMAAAGLWTTPSDLARFVIGVEQSYDGETNPVLSQEMTRRMLTVQNPDLSKSDGLGVFVGGSGKTLRFWHDGRNAGFDALMVGLPYGRRGAAIMTNANDDSGVIKEVLGAIAREYWKLPGG